MEDPNYIPPYTIPNEPKFANWAWDQIKLHSLQPDLISPPGTSEAEIILLELWNSAPPITALNDRIHQVLFRPIPRWSGKCCKCLQPTTATPDQRMIFTCNSCEQKVKDFTRLIEQNILKAEAEKEAAHQEKKKSSKARAKERKQLKKIEQNHKTKEELFLIHPLLGDDPFYFEEDPYYLNKVKTNHLAALEMMDE
jgi:hypothetical protein